jgi:hypothetical protein
MSVGRRASDRASRGGTSEGVGAEGRDDFLRESHDDIVEVEDCWPSSCVGGEDLGFFSDSKRSRNFWISGSVFELEEGVEVDGEAAVGIGVVNVVGGVSLTGAEGLSSLGGAEDHNQPIAMLCRYKNRLNVLSLRSSRPGAKNMRTSRKAGKGN